MKATLAILVFLFTGLILDGFGNNVKIMNVSRTGAGRDVIQFDLSWENSWNVSGAPANHDAIWVIIKYRECGVNGVWNHANIKVTSGATGNSTTSDHSLGSALAFARDVLETDYRGNGTGNNTGVLIRRKAIGIGNISSQTCQLKIEGTATNGVAFDVAKEYDIKVFGIEMVQIPQGSFWIGDGISANRFYAYNNNANAYQVTSEAAILTNTLSVVNTVVTVNSAFPKAYSEFYCMKYEVSQGQYCDFLNTVSSNEANNRYEVRDAWGSHFALVGGVYTTNYPNSAAGYISMIDLISYLDWACLRPMNDIEYEKVCRGPNMPISGDYPWGTAIAADFINATTINGAAAANDGTMRATTTNANINCGAVAVTNYSRAGYNYGPMDVGIFAREGNETRITSGGTYYGVMDMAGSVAEQTVSTYNMRNLFTGAWGDGNLTASGAQNAWVYTYPSYTTTAKGGSFSQSVTNMKTIYARISDLSYYAIGTSYNWNDIRYHDYGGRGVR